MKFRELRKLARANGYAIARQRGTSHEQWYNTARPGMRLTIAGKDGDDVPPRLLVAMLKRMGLR
jgi:predicted RNA binding protein YcfA (HicA-like mRNA interferase family)